MDHRELHCTRIGTGSPLLFVNALYQPRQTWEPIAERLAPHCECILFDFPNQNLVTNGTHPVASFDRPEMYEDYILEVLRALDLEPAEVSACGLSTGANFLRHLHLVRGIPFRRLMLMSIDSPDLANFHAVYNAECQKLLNAAGIEQYAASINFWFFSQRWIHQNHFVIKFIKNRYKTMFSDGHSLPALLRATVATYKRAVPTASFRCPTAMLNGTVDGLCPPAHTRNYANQSGAGFYMVEGAHVFPIESPEPTAEALWRIVAGTAVHANIDEERLRASFSAQVIETKEPL